jgi:hypothetical protein
LGGGGEGRGGEEGGRSREGVEGVKRRKGEREGG